MRKWSKEERALKSYFRAQVEQEKGNLSRENTFWKETAAQLTAMLAGIAVLVILGQFQNYEAQPFEKGIALVAEVFRIFTAL